MREAKTDIYAGHDHAGKPKVEYVARLAMMSEAELLNETEQKIWLSAYAANNPRSDYHWHCDACYDECQRREPPGLYRRAYTRATAR